MKSARHFIAGLSAVVLTGAFIVTAHGEGSGSTDIAHRLEKAASEPQNWMTTGGTYQEQRFSTLDQINATNIGRLKLAWYTDLNASRGQESTPLVVDGTMYVTTSWSKLEAIDAATGKKLWTYDPKVPGKTGVSACCDVVNRGAAYNDGRVFLGTLDGRLIAVDAKTGQLLWSTMTVDSSRSYTITGAPRVVHGKVIIGNGGAEFGVRGYVSAYDAKTGKMVWRFYTVPGDPAKPDHAASDSVMEKLMRPTWYGTDYWKLGGGGTAWDSIVYDPELNQLYIGAGNGSPWNRKIRSQDKGDNLFLASIVALNPDTGAYIWHYQETPGETWDYTASQQITLTDLTINGQKRKVILHAPKTGFFYVIDRTNGKPISAEKFVPVNWADHIDMKTGRPVENPDARFQSKPFISTAGASGAHNWQPMAYSPKTGLVYIPAQQVPFLYVKDPAFQYKPGIWNLGVDMMDTKLPQKPSEVAAMKASLKGWLSAWDPVRQKEVWRVPHTGTWNGGVLATAGDIVFQGLADKTIRAYRASDGKELWSYPTQTGLLPGPITYSVNGTQYVAIAAGNGGGFALALPSFNGPNPSPDGRVLAFKLDGTAELPAFHPTVAALNPSAEVWPASVVNEGQRTFAGICAACHGMGTMSAGVIPDLRRSAALSSKDDWHDIVIGGALQDQGMVSFKKYLTADQAEAVRAYVSGEAQIAEKR